MHCPWGNGERAGDVFAGMAFQHQVHRRENPSDVIRFVIGRGISGAETKLRGRHPHRHQNGGRVHLHDTNPGGHRLGVIARIQIRHRQTIVEERKLDLPVLQRSRDALVIFRCGEVQHRRRMPPRSRQVRAVLRLQKRNKGHHAVHFRGPFRSEDRHPAAGHAAGSRKRRCRQSPRPAPAEAASP